MSCLLSTNPTFIFTQLLSVCSAMPGGQHNGYHNGHQIGQHHGQQNIEQGPTVARGYKKKKSSKDATARR